MWKSIFHASHAFSLISRSSSWAARSDSSCQNAAERVPEALPPHIPACCLRMHGSDGESRGSGHSLQLFPLNSWSSTQTAESTGVETVRGISHTSTTKPLVRSDPPYSWVSTLDKQKPPIPETRTATRRPDFSFFFRLCFTHYETFN